jgi:signal peptidase I
MRIPGFEKIDRNEIVVFNSPADTLYDMNNPLVDRNYYKPVDKKTNLVKRCVGVPGDSLEVRNGYVYINGQQNVLPDRADLQFSYFVQPKTNRFNPRVMYERYGITDPFGIINRQNTYRFTAISEEAVARFRNHPNVLGIERASQEKGVRDPGIFPHHPDYNWNNDHFGPVYIPEAGKTIDLDLTILPLYKRVITEYENNDLRIEGDQIFINDTLATTYTFKQDYYWMMGDNRHNSLDARAWGFTPFDHVVGKPVFIWMSWDKNGKGFHKIRWERVFTTVHGSGERVSYLIPFIVVLIAWYGISKYRKRHAKG